MQLNCKVIKKVATPPPISTTIASFQGYPPFLATFLVPPQVAQFLEGPTPLLTRGEGGSNYALCFSIFLKALKGPFVNIVSV